MLIPPPESPGGPACRPRSPLGGQEGPPSAGRIIYKTGPGGTAMAEANLRNRSQDRAPWRERSRAIDFFSIAEVAPSCDSLGSVAGSVTPGRHPFDGILVVHSDRARCRMARWPLD